MFIRIMIYSLFICSFYQNSLNQHRNLNYTIKGLYNKLNRINLNNKDKNVINQRNTTEYRIERPPWWLNLKSQDNNTVTGIPIVKEFNLYGRKDARRGRSYYAAESTSDAKSNRFLNSFKLLQFTFRCLSLYLINYWLSKLFN